MAISRFVVTADIPAFAWPTAAQLVTTPAVPASTVAQFNPNGFPVSVTVTGGTVTGISVNGTTTGQTSGTVVVPAAGTITLTYSAAPTWTWLPYGAAAGVQSEEAPGYFSSRLPKGTVIYADSTAGNSGPQQLYQAIGAGNLRAYVQGQDDVGHAALAN
jgi:hypothetical protein